MRKTLQVVLCLLTALAVFWISPSDLFSQTQSTQTKPSVVTITNQPDEEEAKTPAQLMQQEKFDPFSRPSITTQAVVLTLLALMPFIVMILTSFMKIVIVLSLLRSALGVQQAPPNQIINGVAFMLSMYVMYPTGLKMYDAAQEAINEASQQEELLSAKTAAYFLAIADKAKDPLKEFLKRNSSVDHQALFYKMSYRVIPPEYRATLNPDNFVILVPAYITSQLKDAFQIGVLIYIPFFVIDLTTSNILLAMGMMMLSPVTISMPLKLFLLVMLDGWTLLVEGLVSTFR
ncbi:MAG: Flagellar biosynthetic protein FliP [Chlamydiae bacterium]|nr:Flagellar biosynthetic protein FliP [Chlamydiota bacterium]